jgi:hypothetical protein
MGGEEVRAGRLREMNDLFIAAFWSVVGLTVALTIVNGFLVNGMATSAPTLFEKLGRPGVGYFLFGQFWGFGPYCRALLTNTLYRRLGESPPALKMAAMASTVLLYGLLVAWIVGVWVSVTEFWLPLALGVGRCITTTSAFRK